MTAWAMVIDLGKCVECETCKQVCDDGNAVPPGATWRRLVHIPSEKSLQAGSTFYTMACMQCKNPTCIDVCPTKATSQRPDGIVTVDAQRCIGCAACVLACPYMARSIVFEEIVQTPLTDLKNGSLSIQDDRTGTCTKCDFCESRLEQGHRDGLQPGLDPEATPLCVRYCVGEAMLFGDLDDENSNVSIILRENTPVVLNEHCGTAPSVYYIPRKPIAVPCLPDDDC